MSYKYCIPLLSEEQNHSVTARQCVDQLIQVENIIDDVFNTIISRIDEDSKKIQALRERAAVAQEKAEKLKGKTKATHIFSTSKYPGREDYEPFKNILNSSLKPMCVSSECKYKPPPYDSTLLNEKLEFFHVRDSEKLNTRSEKYEEGLGKLPTHINSVTSLMLYNTNHCPYKKYEVVDPLGFSSKNDSMYKDFDSVGDLCDAPVSLLAGDEHIAKDEFQYLPDLPDLPELDLPSELPTLSGIANDLTYMGDESVPITPSIPHKDKPSPESETKVSIAETVQQSTEPVATNASNLSTNDIPISKPSSKSGDKNNQQLLSQEIPAPPPPPPPPPPPLPPPVVQTSTPKVAEEKVSQLSQVTDSRSDLMKAIQAAGGAGKAKLKKVKKDDNDEKQDAPKKSVPSNDLMSDLFAKLSQRRKGISGTNIGNEKETLYESKQSTMQKMSSIIPPPPTLTSETDSDTNKHSEDDWDD